MNEGLAVKAVLGALTAGSAHAQDPVPTASDAKAPKKGPTAHIDGTGPGWRALGKDDFQNVNCHEDTWAWDGDAVRCTGQPL